MKHKVLGLAALLLCWPVAAALAGSVYVPLATDHTIDGVRYQTQVWVTNRDTGVRQYTTYFILGESDGTDRPENWGSTNGIAAGGTLLLNTVAGSGQTGLLEVSGAPHIVVNARMVATKNGVTGLGAAMPVISSDNTFGADTTAHLQGWIRSPDLRTDYGIVNLGHQDSNCSISVFRNDGTQVRSTAIVNMPPLAQRQFDDALTILGELAISAVRSETTCDQPFYTYLRTYNRTTGEVFFTLPSKSLADSTLGLPGEANNPNPQGCGPQAAGYFCYSRPGTFFTPTGANDYRRENFDVPAGSYSRMHMRLEVVHGGWTAPTGGLHLVFWLAKAGRHFNLYGFAGFKGPNTNSLLFRHGIGIPAGDKPKFTRQFQAIPGQTYIIDYVYDPVARILELKVMDRDENVLQHITDRPNVNQIHIEVGENITADFSNVLGANPAEPPSYGWQYRNLLIELID